MPRWRYYNANPKGDEEEDCVCRAISTAVGIKYEAAQNLLRISADLNGCDELCVCCYHRLLEGIFGLEVRYCEEGETVEEIAWRHSGQRVLIRIDGHLTCAIMGAILDIWDCSDEIVDCYWVV